MDPIRHLRSELERGISRAWEGLTEGWREVLTRSGGALTHFVRAAKEKRGDAAQEDFPRWGLLASESWETAQSVIVRLEMPRNTSPVRCRHPATACRRRRVRG